MKTRLLLCAVGLMLAGCASQPSHYAAIAQQTYTYDWVEQPLPDLSPDQINALFDKDAAARSPAAILFDNTTAPAPAAIVPAPVPAPAQ